MFFIRVARRRAEQQARLVSTPQYWEKEDYGPVMEWAEVIFRIFYLSLFSGIFYLAFAVARNVLTFHQ